ncbi:MAG: T9SS type A sorting domain-containing protein, partial [Flavobacteriales bacterium]|nr:T9SS type A sorting domain-containing protein [Flavobacteriales bacterium]
FANVCAFGVGAWSYVMDNYTDTSDISGTEDAMISAEFDFATNPDSYFGFDHAYARYSPEYTDTLTLYYTLDCGDSWLPFWTQGGEGLATAPDNMNEFIPTADEWDSMMISLAFLNGQSSVHIAITNRSGWGNKLYIDNINIFTPAIVNPSWTDFAGLPDTICEGDMVSFQDWSLNYPTSWNWTLPGGTPPVSTDQNPVVQYNVAGEYDVDLATSNIAGGDNWTYVDHITVVPFANLTISSGSTTICQGDGIILTASGGQNYSWSSDGYNVIGYGSNYFSFPNQTTTYTLFGENSLGCQSSTQITIIVNPLPAVPTISLSGNDLMSSSSASYQWFSSSVSIPGEIAQTYMPLVDGTYSVLATDINGCTALSADEIFILTESKTRTSIGSDAVSISPNPASDYLNISGLNNNATVKVISLEGRLVIDSQLQPEQSIDVSGLSQGLYTVSVITNGNVTNHKVIIE